MLSALAAFALAFPGFGGGEARHTTELLGRSAEGRAIRATVVGNPNAVRRVLVVGCIHGDECAGIAVTRRLARRSAPRGTALWLLHQLNPDGAARGVRQNGRGVDLNRNFPSGWRPLGRRWDPQYSGPRPLSEPEARIARRLVLRVRPELTVWFHQPQTLVRAWGPSVAVARRYARLAGMRYGSIRWPHGTAPNWQNHRFPGTPSFVVELAPGALAPRRAAHHAATILALTRREGARRPSHPSPVRARLPRAGV
jgi:protein MpaA